MKKMMMLLVVTLFVSCNDDEGSPTMPVNDEFDPMKAGVTLLRQGMLEGAGGHIASGTAKIYDDGGVKFVVLDPFDSQNGPDLKVYLSTDDKASKYMNLGALKSTTGKQTYQVEGMPDLNEYKYVLVWCEKFTVLFARAEMK